jgi:hypothetical protein
MQKCISAASKNASVVLRVFRQSPSYPGDRGSTVVKVLCYKSEGRCFDSR